MPAIAFLLDLGQEFPKNFEPILEHRLRLVAEKSSFPLVHIPLDETRIAGAMEGALVLQEPHSTFHRLAGLLQYTCNAFAGTKSK